jgi:hypothetical protein
MRENKYKIGDLVKIDYSIDWVPGFVVKVYKYDDENYYDIVDFFDGEIDKHIREQCITYLEEESKSRLLDTDCETG